MKKRALVSVSDKTNIVEFCKNLEKLNFEIVSTGGTLELLKENQICAINISEVTKFPEILDGRVKTLSPYIHGGLLYKRDNTSHVNQAKENEIAPIDLVCVNLYPFEEAVKTGDIETIIENIDIGGPSMIRSAAKNYKDVIVVTDINDYQKTIEVITDKKDDILYKQKLAIKAFNLTARYESIISNYLVDNLECDTPKSISLTYDLNQELRYGENPHQKASFYSRIGGKNTIENCDILHGKQLSYNNIQDAQAALNLLAEFTNPTVCAIKHMSPCGVGIANNIDDAWEKAYSADPISIFGGIIVTNQTITKLTAQKMNDIFLEVIIAPDFEPEALGILSSKKNLRILKLNDSDILVTKEFKSVGNALLVQDVDLISNYDIEYQTVTKVQPTQDDISQLKFAQSVVKHVKSNGITVVHNNQTVGVGTGQTSRIASAEIALKNAKKLGFTNDLYLASDAFFPFDDCVELAHKYGVKAIVQPGGSIKDQDSINKCNELNIAMVFTNKRHFRH